MPVNNLTNNFVTRLHQAMTDHGYGKPQRSTSQTGIDHLSLAKATGINREVLRRYLMGQADPTDQNIQILASHLNVEPGWLRFGTGHKHTHRVPILTLQKPFPSPDHLPQARQQASDFAHFTCMSAQHDWFAISMSEEKSCTQFSAGTLLIFDPHLLPENYDFILVTPAPNKDPIIAQLIIEEGIQYLRSLTLDPHLRPLHESAIIHGVYIGTDHSRVDVSRRTC